MAKRFTEAEKQAALMDLKGGMTLEQASKKHKCSTASLMQWKKVPSSGAKTDRPKYPDQRSRFIKQSIGT